MFFSLMFLLPMLSWQAAVLKAYRRVLEDDSFRDDLDRRFARLLLEAYLEHRSRHQSPGQSHTTQAGVIDDWLQILQAFERVLRARP